jgi:hypothetical protein
MWLTPELVTLIVRRPLKKRYLVADRSADAVDRDSEGY